MSYAGEFSKERKFKIIGHLQQIVHDTLRFLQQMIDEIWHLSVLLLRLPPKRAFDSRCLTKRVEQFSLEALKRVLRK